MKKSKLWDKNVLKINKKCKQLCRNYAISHFSNKTCSQGNKHKKLVIV